MSVPLSAEERAEAREFANGIASAPPGAYWANIALVCRALLAAEAECAELRKERDFVSRGDVRCYIHENGTYNVRVEATDRTYRSDRDMATAVHYAMTDVLEGDRDDDLLDAVGAPRP